MKITKSKLRQIIKEELIREVSSLQREEEEEARCVGFMHKRSDELSKTLPSLNEDGPMISDILIQLQLQYLSLEHHELKRFQRKAGNCYKLFVKALEEVGAEGTHTWPEAKQKLADSPRYSQARDVYEEYYKSEMSPKKMVDLGKRMGTATTLPQVKTKPRVKTKPLTQAPMPPRNRFDVGKLGPDGRYRFK